MDKLNCLYHLRLCTLQSLLGMEELLLGGLGRANVGVIEDCKATKRKHTDIDSEEVYY